MTEGMTCYERDEDLCEDQMCLRAGCKLRNERLRCSAVSDEAGTACKNCRHRGSHLAWRCDACGFEVKRPLPTEPQTVDTTEALRKQAFALSCHEQFRLASFVAENLGYVLSPDPLRGGPAEPPQCQAESASQAVKEPDAWEWRYHFNGRAGAWIGVDQPIARFRENEAFNLENGTYELRPLYAGEPLALSRPQCGGPE